MERSIKVKLKTDLTRYHPKLHANMEGVTVGAYGLWSRGSDRFTGVHFPGIGTFDVLWESLAIVDEDFLREAAERDQEKRELMKHATNIVKAVGPRGGFRHLSYEYASKDSIRCHVSTTSRTEAEMLLQLFADYGLVVREQVM